MVYTHLRCLEDLRSAEGPAGITFLSASICALSGAVIFCPRCRLSSSCLEALGGNRRRQARCQPLVPACRVSLNPLSVYCRTHPSATVAPSGVAVRPSYRMGAYAQARRDIIPRSWYSGTELERMAATTAEVLTKEMVGECQRSCVKSAGSLH